MTAPRGAAGVSSAARGAILVGLAVIIGIVGLQILDDSGPASRSNTRNAPVTTIGVATGTGTGASTTTVARRPNSQVKVKVYNASGVQGRAQILTDQLKALGYNTQVPANLTTQRTGTAVECMPGFKREGTLLALYGVGNGATVEKYPSNPPNGASDAECIVIIGNA